MTKEFPDFLQVLGRNVNGDTVVYGRISGQTYTLTKCCRAGVTGRSTCEECGRAAYEDTVATRPF